ncbi:uncharacterized protein LOC128556247 [Mercenaria mercenaria]|uniref:uncharacterized protein LOC128556247 n=1 Tax=Mercenaria mercenaria TaxID=6596 RepID=UPI00234F7C1B|nr:uncharacterized protein LOC128556247 [Mercenaria mercenaria]
MAFQAKERFRFVFSGLTHGSDGTGVLVAGDSNVRHICNSIDADSKNVDPLTIPGARILRDGKGFLNALTAKLSRNTFERLYLHLGSNDVLSSQEKYMSSLMSLCDHIHEMSLSQIDIRALFYL